MVLLRYEIELTYFATPAGRRGSYHIRARLQACREKRVQQQGLKDCVKTAGSLFSGHTFRRAEPSGLAIQGL